MLDVLTLVLLIIVCAVSANTRKHQLFMDENNDSESGVQSLHEIEDAVLRRYRFKTRQMAYLLSYGKKYGSNDEMKKRYLNFVESLEMISSHNSKGLSYTLGVNEFADMSWEEFSKGRLGAAQHYWRKVGIMSLVKNQGSRGSCWTFRGIILFILGGFTWYYTHAYIEDGVTFIAISSLTFLAKAESQLRMLFFAYSIDEENMLFFAYSIDEEKKNTGLQ
ncbi:thiol protease aleurain-like protein [Tanacetum coccineum]